MPQAARRRLRSQLAVRRYNDGKTLDGLDLYSTMSHTIDPDAVHAAQLFATHASIALRDSQQQHQLNEALASRKVIGQAIGILMQRYKIDQDRAFQFLLRASSTSTIKLRSVAQELVVTTDKTFPAFLTGHRTDRRRPRRPVRLPRRVRCVPGRCLAKAPQV